MYRALYRKWRPQTFADVIGQQAITTALANQITSGKLGHAFLFTGTRGTGKTSCAKILAKAVNCENRQGASPCGECAPCKGLEDGSILDVIEIDAASNNGVDDIRDLRDETAYRPSRCQYKVYIIDEVHMLSTAAFNALLKIMEEPPAHVIFILATTEIHKVPATILSRCQRYDFGRIPAEAMAQRLLDVAGEEGIGLTPDAADMLARLADGAMRDAFSLLDTCAGVGEEVDEALVRRMAGVTDKGYLFELGEAVAGGDPAALLAQIARLREQSIDVKRLCEELVHHYRNIMLAAAKPDGSLLQSLPADERARYTEAAKATTAAFAISAVRRLAEAMDKMGRSPDPRIELELALFDLCQPAAPAPQVQPVAAPPVQVAAHSAAAPVAQSKPVAALQTEPPKATSEPPPWEVEEQAPPIPEKPSVVQAAAPVAAQPVPEHTAPVKQAAPAQQGVPEGLTAFEPWPQVIQAMMTVDRMLYSYMKESEAYLQGGRVLINGGDMFLSYMREYKDAGEKIKNVIEQVTGKRSAIGPYAGPEQKQQKQITAQDTLRDWEQKGVPVEYEA